MNNRPLHLEIIWDCSFIPLQCVALCDVFGGLSTTCVFIDNVRHYVHNCTIILSHDITEIIDRHIPTHALFVQLFRWPCICEGRHYLIFLFCFMKRRTLLTRLLFRHMLPIDEHLQNFQLKMLIGMCYLLINIYKIFNWSWSLRFSIKIFKIN